LATPTHKSLRVLFVDDEMSLQEFMRTELPSMGHTVTVCPDGASALRVLDKHTFDAAILDLRMPGMSGLDVLAHLKQKSPDTEAVVMTGHASMETAVEAMRLGAFDYITKPCKLAEIEAILLRILDKRALKHQNLALQTRVQAAEGGTKLIGSSPAMLEVQRTLAMVAPTDSVVLITGETGTGKEVAARTLFELSRRKTQPYVPVNCAAFTENLVESEIFGHVKNAFTGAERDKKGLFEVANGGTLFLDELGELNRNIQSKLLRFLESGEIRRLGDTQPFKADVRVVCATNRDLRQMIADDTFREDLFFRINTFELRLPPLRERRVDIPDLARHLLARAARRPIEQVADLLTRAAVDMLFDYDWPGNVRELANMMEYSYIVAGGGPIAPDHFPQHVRTPKGKPNLGIAVGTGATTVAAAGPTPNARTLKVIEMEHILRVYEKNGHNKQATANELGISLKTLYNKLNAYEDEKRHATG
jgi:DNA-binding NtrC family response regulator